MLQGYYDLARCPPTYDVVAFLSHLEIARHWHGEDEVEIGILPGPVHGFRQDTLWPQDVAVRRSMLERIVVPMCRMLPKVTTVTVHTKREGAKGIGVGAYIVGLKQHVEALKAGIRPLRVAETVPRDPRLVTITLREAEHWPERNSNVAEWIEAARRIERAGFRVELVRDTSHADERIGEFASWPAASRDLVARAQLYRSAVCNLGVSNGPMWFAVALDAPMLMVKPVTETGRTNGSAYFARCGVPPGSQLPTSPKYQRIAWVEDAADEIERAFGSFMEAQ